MKVLAPILVLLFIAATSYTAFAHGDEARIELSVTQASPGATIDLRGSGFEPGDTTTITLVSTGRQALLGSAAIDDHGDLIYAVLLPMDLANGAYEVRVADSHHVAAAPLNIVPDSGGNEEGSQRGEDEPLLAPMPARAADTSPNSTAAPSANMTTSLPTTETDPSIAITVLLSSALAIVILSAGIVFILRRFR